MKNCNLGTTCQYRHSKETGSMCSYEGYCDYQLPKDSRMQPLYPQYERAQQEFCDICNLPLYKCKGHTIC